MSGLNALAKRILRPLARPWLEAIAGKVAPLLGRGDLSPEGERIQFDLRVVASLRGLAQVGDHRVVLPYDSARAVRSTKEIKVGFFGNIANNAYNFTKCLRRLGYDAELVLEDGVFDAFLMNRPFWEDLEVECDTYEEGLTHEHRWVQPDFVRRVAFDPQMQSRFQGRLSAVPEVQALYKEAFGVELPVYRALVLAQQMGHWAYLLAMKRYDVVQFSGAPISLGPFCSRPYVVFPTGSDLFIAPFEQTMLGLLMRAGYRLSAHLLVCEPNYPSYLYRLDLLAPRSFTPLMVDTDTYALGASDTLRAAWKQQVGGERFLLGVCRQSWEWKGNDRLIRGFAQFAKDEGHGQWRLILIRWGPDVERTKALIAELGIAGKVLWENLLSKPLLRQRQQAADLVADQFVMPGYGTSVLESLAVGKPVLMKGQAGHRISYLLDPPPFIPASEPEEIAQGLAQATAGDFLIQRGKASRKWVVDCHGYKAVADSYLAVYYSVLGYQPVNPPVLHRPAGSLTSQAPAHHLGLSTSSKQILNDLVQLHLELRLTMKDKFDRAVPLGDELTDRWERARFLGFGSGSSIYDGTLVLGNVKVGENTWIGPHCILDGSGGLEIGSHCSVAAGCHLYSHNTVRWALSGGKREYERRPTRIGDACYIGPHAVIAAGVTVGSHCLIGALAFVNRDVPDHAILVGIPARIIGRVEIGPDGSVRLRYDQADEGPEEPFGIAP